MSLARSTAVDDLQLLRWSLRGLAREAQPKKLPYWTPQPGPQELIWNLDCDEIGFGGAAGGGKTSIAAALPMPRVKLRGYRALILRRNTPDLAKIVDEVKAIYQDGRDNAGQHSFRAFAPGDLAQYRGDIHWLIFPRWGSRIELGHCHNVDDYRSRMGQEYDDIIFDEATQFEEVQYTSIASRRRGTIRGIRRRVIATMNPPERSEPGEEWVRRRWAPWVNPDAKLDDWEERDDRGNVVRGYGLPQRYENGRRVPPAASGQILYVAKVRGQERFSTEPFEWDGAPTQTRTFVRALLSDNPAMLEAEPNYRAKLRDNDAVRAEQLENGNWEIRPAAGLYFQRHWVGDFLPRLPPGPNVQIRSWDLAATAETPGKEPAFTAGVRMAKTASGLYCITDAKRVREGPGGVLAFIKATAQLDGHDVWISLPQDPGQAGKYQVAEFIRALQGYHVIVAPTSGDKITRFGPFSTAANPKSTGGSTGLVRIIEGPWNAEYVLELERFPFGLKDQADATGDAYNILAPIEIEEDEEDWRPVGLSKRR